MDLDSETESPYQDVGDDESKLHERTDFGHSESDQESDDIQQSFWKQNEKGQAQLSQWCRLPNLIDARENHSSIALQHQVFVVCGHDGRKNLRTVEFLDLAPRQGPWLRKSLPEWQMIGDYCCEPRQSPILS